jgi:general secretion pathway protein D
MTHRTQSSTRARSDFWSPLFWSVFRPAFRSARPGVDLRSGFGAAFALLVAVAFFGLLSPSLYASGPSANSYFKHGQAAEAHQDYDTAYEDYQKAFQKNPKDLRYQTALYRVRVSAAAAHISAGRKLFQSGNLEGALAEFLHASEIDPSNEEAQQEVNQVRQKQGQAVPPPEMAVPELAGEEQELETIEGPVQLKPMTNEPLTLHMTQDTKIVYQAIGKAAGINVLFDPDYNSKRIEVDLNNVSLLDALRIVGTMSNTFWRPITANSIFVAQNTRVKRTELDEQAVQTFYLANAWQQNDLNDVQTALRNVLPNTKVFGVQSQNAIVMRGTPDELLLAAKIISDLDKPRAEVVVDTAVLEVSKNWERTIGISWPSSVGVALQAPNSSSSSSTSCPSGETTCSTSSTSPTLYSLSHLKASDFAVTVGAATLNLLLTDADTQILQDPRIRATDGQKADMKIGSKIPIATGSYQTGAATALVSSLVNTQFQYEDVGVEIEVTPSVHYDHDVTLKVKIQVTAQSGSVTISGVTEPILSQRVIDQVIRLREGEASILGGIQDNEDQQSWTGIPGLSSIPILKYIFGSKDHTIQNDEIVFVVVPHIVRSQYLDQDNLRAIDTGSGQSIDLRRTMDGTSAPGVRPTALEQPIPGQPAPGATQPGFGTVPSQSADVAAPQAMAQMRQSQQANFNPPPSTPPAPAQPTPAQQAAAAQARQAALNNLQNGAEVGAPHNSAPSAPAGMQPSPPANAPPANAPPANAPPANAPPANAPPANASPSGVPQAGAPPPGGPVFSFNPPAAPLATGTVFQVPVVVNSASNVASVPIQIHFDPGKLGLINVDSGNFLSGDGQAAALIHRDDGQGTVTIVASRPPGAAGVSGGGVVCVLSFQAKASGPSALTMTHAAVVTSAQQTIAAQSSPANVTVR